MSSTQELSQWMLERNDQNNGGIALNYTPRQSRYVAFEDLDLGITQHQTQIDITPQVATRSEIFPENKRFTEPETPVPGGGRRRINNGDVSSESNDFQTPCLPAIPFENPFGPVHGEGNDGMGLTQVFKATQAATTPNLLRRQPLPSSQRPSPNVLAKNIFDLQSDLIYERSPGMADLKEITDMIRSSSSDNSVHIEPSSDSQKRALEEDDNDSLSQISDDSAEQHNNRKRRRMPAGDRDSGKMGGTTRHESPRTLRSARRGNAQQITGPVVIDDDINSAEDETEREDEIDDGDMHGNEDDIEADKENRVGYHEIVAPRAGLQVKRASKALLNQNIPLSSSPAVTRHQVQVKVADNSTNEENQAQSSSPRHIREFGAFETGQQVTIADSQSSQKPDIKQTSNDGHHRQIGSSNDSRRVIPQSQAIRLSSSLQIVTTQALTSMGSQPPVSPPHSGSGRLRNRDHALVQSHGQKVAGPNSGLPASPRSSPPVLRQQDRLVQAGGDEEVDEDEADTDTHFNNNPAEAPDLQVKNSTTLVGRTPAIGGTRSASTIPETRYIKRRNDVFAVGAPTSRRDPFSLAEDMEFSLQGPSQSDKSRASAARSLNNSFGLHQVEDTLHSPVRKTPAKPRTFSSIDIHEAQSQEPDSVELAIWSTQDRAMCEDIFQYPGSGSSPLPAGRKRRRGNGRRLILLDKEPDEDALVMPSEAMPVQQVSILEKDDAFEAATGEAPQVGIQVDIGISDIQTQPKTPIREEEEEAIPFMDLHIPMKQYSNKTKQLKRKRGVASTAPVETANTISAVPRRRGRPRKHPISQAPTVTNTQKSIKPTTARSSRRSTTAATTFATARTQQSIITELTAADTSLDAKPLPNRVFARFQGSYSGYYAATCVACSEHEMEKKYKVRFDDGTSDLIGTRFIKQLELRIGDEVKVDRGQMRASTFVVTGFGSKLDTEELSANDFPMTDVYGHEMVKLIEKMSAQNKKNPKPTKEIEIPITEIFFTAGLWSAIRDRDYSHTVSNVGSTHTPLVSKPASVFNSPSSRTRSTNKLNFSASVGAGPVPLEVATDQSWTADQSGVFKDVVFVFTGVDIYERKKLVKTVGQQGGVAVEDFQELFDLSGTRILNDENDATREVTTSNGRSDGSSIRLKSRFASTRLAVLVTPTDNRNTKYYQALALGVPCLSQHWIKDSLHSGKLKNWRPYLLAAGHSIHLGTTISRQLNFTHKELEDPNLDLAKIIDRRDQWLAGDRIILVGSDENGSMTRLRAHMFIALVLGASQVLLAKDGKEVNQYMAESKHSFDWICVDNEKEKEKGPVKSEKRSKLYSSTVMESLRQQDGLGNTKVVGAQLVLQSLIVGSLLSWDEIKQQRAG